MPDQRTRQLLPATFRGVRFSVRNEVQTQAGRRIVLHEYLNSNERFVEDLGQLSPQFRVTAFVHGQDYLSRSLELQRALNEAGPGRLVMPTLGQINVYALPYRINSSQTTVGEIQLDLEFAVGRVLDGPGVAAPALQDVYASGENAREAVQDGFADSFEASVNPDNATVSAFDGSTVLNQVNENYEGVLPDDAFTNILGTVRDVSSTIHSLQRRANEYSQRIFNGTRQVVGYYQQVSNAVATLTDADALREALESTIVGRQLTLSLSAIRGAVIAEPVTTDTVLNVRTLPELEEAAEVPLWEPTTTIRQERNRARETIVQAHRLGSLTIAYEQAAQRNYGTAEAVEEARNQLELVNDLIMRIDIADEDSLQNTPEIRTAIQELRAVTFTVLDQKVQQTASTTTVNVPRGRSALLLAYDYYAEGIRSATDLEISARSIRALNPQDPALSLAGDIEIFKL